MFETISIIVCIWFTTISNSLLSILVRIVLFTEENYFSTRNNSSQVSGSPSLTAEVFSCSLASCFFILCRFRLFFLALVFFFAFCSSLRRLMMLFTIFALRRSFHESHSIFHTLQPLDITWEAYPTIDVDWISFLSIGITFAKLFYFSFRSVPF